MAKKTITLKGQHITYGGRLLRVKWDVALEAKVKAKGGELTGTISDKLTLFVAGTRAGSKQTKAITRGATAIDEAQFEELLEHGEIEIETRVGVERDLDLNQVLGEVRSLLAAPAQNASWSALLDILERCDEDHLTTLVNYIAPQINAWGARKKWSTSQENPLFGAFYPAYWVTGLPQAHMCVAPPLWMLEALREECSVRHQLARALNFEGMKLHSGLAKRILDHPEWRNIRALNLGIQNTYAPGFFITLMEHPLMQHVEELWMDHDPVGLFGDQKVDDTIFPALKLLRCRFPQVRYTTDSSPEALRKMREESGWIGEDVVINAMTY